MKEANARRSRAMNFVGEALMGLVAVFLSFPPVAHADDFTLAFEKVEGGTWATARASKLLGFIESDQSAVTKKNSDRARYLVNSWALKEVRARFDSDPGFHYGALGFRELFERFERVKIYIVAAPVTVQVSRERPSDVYLFGRNAVILNQDFFKSENNGRAGVILHTMLGAIGYEDENYQLSTLLSLAEICNRKIDVGGQSEADAQTICRAIDLESVFPQTIDEIKRESPRADRDLLFSNDRGKTFGLKDAEGGGFTGVGGGGDYRAVIFKLGMMGFAIPEWRDQVLPLECSRTWRTASEFLREFLPLKIEVSDRVSDVFFESGSILVPSSVIYQPRPTAEAALKIISRVCSLKAERK